MGRVGVAIQHGLWWFRFACLRVAALPRSSLSLCQPRFHTLCSVTLPAVPLSGVSRDISVALVTCVPYTGMARHQDQRTAATACYAVLRITRHSFMHSSHCRQHRSKTVPFAGGMRTYRVASRATFCLFYHVGLLIFLQRRFHVLAFTRLPPTNVAGCAALSTGVDSFKPPTHSSSVRAVLYGRACRAPAIARYGTSSLAANASRLPARRLLPRVTPVRRAAREKMPGTSCLRRASSSPHYRTWR